MAAPSPQDSRKVLKLPRHLTKVPRIAYPTLALCGTSLLAWAQLQHLLWYDKISHRLALPLLATLSYISFTPMHDASHNAVFTHSSGFFGLNGLIGRLASIPLLVPFVAFRYLHMQHHKYTNDDEQDPDLWSGRASAWYLLPFKWSTQLIHYYIRYFGQIFDNNNNNNNNNNYEQSRPKTMEIIESFGTILGVYITTWLAPKNIQKKLVINFHIPASIAIVFLAFIFDYIPHRPHATANMYSGTNVTSLMGNTRNYLKRLKRIKMNNNNINNINKTSGSQEELEDDHDYENMNDLEKDIKEERKVFGGGGSGGSGGLCLVDTMTPIMLYQNFHNIHHLYPWLPFYKYSAIWYKFDEYFIQEGTKIVPFFPLFLNKSSVGDSENVQSSSKKLTK